MYIYIFIHKYLSWTAIRNKPCVINQKLIWFILFTRISMYYCCDIDKKDSYDQESNYM